MGSWLKAADKCWHYVNKLIIIYHNISILSILICIYIYVCVCVYFVLLRMYSPDCVIQESSSWYCVHRVQKSFLKLPDIWQASFKAHCRGLSESPNDWRPLEPWCKRCMFADPRVFWWKTADPTGCLLFDSLAVRTSGKSLHSHTFDKALWIYMDWVPGMSPSKHDFHML